MTQAAWVEVPFEVESPQDGQRVDAYLVTRLHRYSRTEVQRLISSGRVLVRGRAAKSATRVAAGETVTIRYPRHLEPPCRYEALPLLHEDEQLLAVAKPGDILSHPTDKIIENTATSILKRQFPDARLHLVHRLDRETSGVLLLAKDPKSARALSELFFERRIRKEYLAVVAGKVAWKEKTVDLPLGKEGLEIKVRQTTGRGVPALTHFSRVKVIGGTSLVRAVPKTGRLHQIRVHLAAIGHPIIGDKLYTGRGELYMKAVRKELTSEDIAALGAARQLLHAEILELTHPVTGKALRIHAPLPDDFKWPKEK